MSTPQRKTGSGFGFESTAAEVVEGIDLGGKLAVVTGGYSGVGLETVRALVGAGAKVVVPARRPDHAREQLAGFENVEVDDLQLDDLESVRAFSERFLATDRKLDLLINNAGVMATPEFRVGHNWEGQFATNHLGHYVLTNLVWPALTRDGGNARVVELTSAAHRLSPIRFDDLHFERDPYDKWLAYGQSKTANSLFALHLDKLGQDAGVRAFAVHPGGIMTPLQRHLSQEEMQASGWIDEHGNPRVRFKTPEQGAATTVWCATSPQLDGKGGVYCADCDIADIVEQIEPGGGGVLAHAVDPDQAARLWEVSAQLTGVDAFAGVA
jgi:NAD(P)-dependent dehydrogenase (short-subunit alcohol dehydrogenase family)